MLNKLFDAKLKHFVAGAMNGGKPVTHEDELAAHNMLLLFWLLVALVIAPAILIRIFAL